MQAIGGKSLIGKLVEFRNHDTNDECYLKEEKAHLTLGGVYVVIDWDAYDNNNMNDVLVVRGDSGTQVILLASQVHVVGDINANKDNFKNHS